MLSEQRALAHTRRRRGRAKEKCVYDGDATSADPSLLGRLRHDNNSLAAAVETDDASAPDLLYALEQRAPRERTNGRWDRPILPWRLL